MQEESSSLRKWAQASGFSSVSFSQNVRIGEIRVSGGLYTFCGIGEPERAFYALDRMSWVRPASHSRRERYLGGGLFPPTISKLQGSYGFSLQLN
jgi:hypothetical protein